MRIWRFYKCFCILLSWHTFALGWRVRDWLIRCYSATCSSLTLKALFFLMAIRFIPWVGFIYTFVLVYNAILAQKVSSCKKIISKLDYIQKKTVCRVTAYPAYSQSGNVTYLFFCFKYDNLKSSMPFPISISHSGTEYESPASSAIFLTLSIASITRSL